MIKRAVKKPVEIECIKFTGDNLKDVEEFAGEDFILSISGVNREDDKIVIEGTTYINTLEGRMHVTVGDYIVKGVQGEFYPVKPDIFQETYRILD